MLIEIAQGTKEWLDMRAGMVTASKVADVIGKGAKGQYYAARADYLDDVSIGRLTGLNPETYVSKAMEAGIENEPLARAAYERRFDVIVEDGGFAQHDRIKWFGASPDGLVGSDGLIEIKCPLPRTHWRYLLAKQVPAEYQPQMLAQMACTGRKWCDFVSYCDWFSKKHRLFVMRLERDDKRIAEMEAEIEKFLAEVETRIASLEMVPHTLEGQLSESLKQVSR